MCSSDLRSVAIVTIAADATDPGAIDAPDLAPSRPAADPTAPIGADDVLGIHDLLDAFEGDVSALLRRLDGATRAITQIGTSAVNWSYTARGAARPDSSIALIVGGNESTTGWRARFIDLTTGVQTPAVVSGYAWPAGLEYHDMVWVPVIEKFVALLYNRSYLDDQVVRDVRLITLQPTGGANLVAALVPVAGAAPTTSGGWVRGLYWDPALSVLILGNGPTNPLKAIRVA